MPTSNRAPNYSPREIDLIVKSVNDATSAQFVTLHQRMDSFESDTSGNFHDVKRAQSYTNGKVRKIIIALVLIGGIIIGQTITSPEEIVKLISHLI